MTSNEVITLAAEFLFAAIFLRALWAYARSRDPLQRQVVLAFLGTAAISATDIARHLAGPLPPAVPVISLTLLLSQPYLTLRLAGGLGPVPRWLNVPMLLAWLVTTAAFALAPRPLSDAQLAVVVVVFAVSESVAAGFLTTAARRRTGPSRTRLLIAAWATGLFAAAIVGLAVARIGGPAVAISARVLALLSGLGYVVAFLPPRWLRRVWAATASHAVAEQILRAPATETAGQTWQRYARVVRAVAGADAVAVLVRTANGTLAQRACDGISGPLPRGLPAGALDDLLAARQPVRLAGPATPGGQALAAHYSGQVGGGGYITVLPLRVPPTEDGALLIANEYRGPFGEDDLRLLADLGGQAGILAERGTVIAEQRRLARELTDSVTALTKASQAKSDFMASMSHELRTPLNAIIGFSDLMRSESADDDHRRVPAEWVDHIHSSGRHLLGLINDILDLAKVEAGQLDLQPVALRLDTATAEVVTTLRPLADVKGLDVRVDVPPLVANADPVRFRQILENLLSNAIKFTPAGGRITVTGAADGSDVSICVADTGIGIDAGDQALVFQEFQQLGDPQQRQAGTGLGLALTQRLVQAHGGEIELASARGAGSRFTVRLPVAAVAPPPRHDRAGDRPPSRGRVLLVDDDLRAAELVRTYLHDAGYEVTVAPTGEAGLAAAREHPPDAVLLDVVLPGIQGWDVLTEMKRDHALAHVPVFFVTMIDERRAGLGLGAAEYFVKPVDHDQLLAALARHALPDSRRHASVLVVDLDDDTRGTVQRGLLDAGADVVACAGGPEGLAASRQQHFDLLVCDMTQPDVDGFALLSSQLRERGPEAPADEPGARQAGLLALTANGVDAAGQPVPTGKVLGVADDSPAWDSLLGLARHHEPDQPTATGEPLR